MVAMDSNLYAEIFSPNNMSLNHSTDKNRILNILSSNKELNVRFRNGHMIWSSLSKSVYGKVKGNSLSEVLSSCYSTCVIKKSLISLGYDF